ncbi:formin-like protein 20 [Abeliophyllum distichum]|uniref:Formin-like protein 20 n=1 Tax=Abeliophyllum distichum TaxID=126358 RepID=A0ABD1TD72_9LAMI
MSLSITILFLPKQIWLCLCYMAWPIQKIEPGVARGSWATQAITSLYTIKLNIVFEYDTRYHNSASVIATFSAGNDSITINSSGHYYYISVDLHATAMRARRSLLWENQDNRFRYFNDFEVKLHRTLPVAKHFHRCARRNEAERDEPDTPVKVILVDKYKVSTTPPPRTPTSPPPPPSPPPAASLKRIRSFHSVPQKE